MPSTILGTRLARPLMRVGSPASVRCDAMRLSPGGGKKRLFTVAIDPGAAILMTISIGIVKWQQREDVARTKPQQNDTSLPRAPESASETQSRARR